MSRGLMVTKLSCRQFVFTGPVCIVGQKACVAPPAGIFSEMATREQTLSCIVVATLRQGVDSVFSFA